MLTHASCLWLLFLRRLFFISLSLSSLFHTHLCPCRVACRGDNMLGLLVFRYGPSPFSPTCLRQLGVEKKKDKVRSECLRTCCSLLASWDASGGWCFPFPLLLLPPLPQFPCSPQSLLHFPQLALLLATPRGKKTVSQIRLHRGERPARLLFFVFLEDAQEQRLCMLFILSGGVSRSVYAFCFFVSLSRVVSRGNIGICHTAVQEGVERVAFSFGQLPDLLVSDLQLLSVWSYLLFTCVSKELAVRDGSVYWIEQILLNSRVCYEGWNIYQWSRGTPFGQCWPPCVFGLLRFSSFFEPSYNQRSLAVWLSPFLYKRRMIN